MKVDLHLFAPDQPDLNWETLAVRKAGFGPVGPSFALGMTLEIHKTNRPNLPKNPFAVQLKMLSWNGIKQPLRRFDGENENTRGNSAVRGNFLCAACP